MLIGQSGRHFLDVEALLQQSRCFSHALFRQPLVRSTAKDGDEPTFEGAHLHPKQPGKTVDTKAGLGRDATKFPRMGKTGAHTLNTFQEAPIYQKSAKIFLPPSGRRNRSRLSMSPSS